MTRRASDEEVGKGAGIVRWWRGARWRKTVRRRGLYTSEQRDTEVAAGRGHVACTNGEWPMQ